MAERLVADSSRSPVFMDAGTLAESVAHSDVPTLVMGQLVDDSGTMLRTALSELGLEAIDGFCHLRGRTKLSREDKGWATAKWASKLSLSALPNPLTEVGLEGWAASNVTVLQQNPPTFLILFNLILGMLPPTLSDRVRRVEVHEDILTLQGVIDLVVKGVFRGTQELERLERTIFNVTRCASVGGAHARLRSLLETYGYMCLRHKRVAAVYPPQLRSIFMSLVPEEMEREGRIRYGRAPLADLVEHLLDLSECYAPQTPCFAAVRPIEVSPLPANACHACGQVGHFRQNCPHARSKCSHCGRKGHLAVVCPTVKQTDELGRTQATVEIGRRNLNLRAQTNPTQRSQLKTAAEFLNKMAAPRPAWGEWTDVEMGERTAETADASQERDTDTGTPLVGYCGNGSGLLETCILIEGKPTNVILDGGSAFDCLPGRLIQERGIEMDPRLPLLAVTGVGGQAHMDATVPVLVQLGEKSTPILISFKRTDDRIPPLIGASTQRRMGLRLDLQEGWVADAAGRRELVLVASAEKPNIRSTSLDPVEEADIASAFPNSDHAEVADFFRARPQLLRATKGGSSVLPPVLLRPTGKPFRCRPRPLAPHLKEVAAAEVRKLLESELIESTPDARWSSPIHYVRKKDGTWRLTIDYRMVNERLPPPAYPLPAALDIFPRLGGATLFSTLDLRNGFWNVRLDPSTRECTAFAVPGLGVFTWKVLPFGARPSPAEFQRSLEAALHRHITEGYVALYIDDIIIFSRSEEEHKVHVLAVLNTLLKSELCIKLNKCAFFRQEVRYLGQRIGRGRIFSDPDRVKALQQLKSPATAKELRSAMGAMNYLRMFVPSFASLTTSLKPLTRQQGTFAWRQVHEEAFRRLLRELGQHTMLYLPDPQRPFVIHSDASDLACGACLFQEVEEALHPIHYLSHAFTETEKRWSVTEREIFAVMWALEGFDRYVRGAPVRVHTDHKALAFLKTAKAPKLARWAARIAEYAIDITFIPGNDNCVADWLSRIELGDEDEVPSLPMVLFAEPTLAIAMPSVQDIKNHWRTHSPKEPNLVEYEGLFFGGPRMKPLVPQDFRQAFLFNLHSRPGAGHAGANRCCRKAREMVFWPGMAKDITQYVARCTLCNMLRSPNHPSGLRAGALRASRPFAVVSMDFVGPRHIGGRPIHIVVIIDHHTRFMATSECEGPTAGEARRALATRWVAYFGAPHTLLCDQGPAFISCAFQSYVEDDLGCRLAYSSSYHPEGNGINEASHRFLEHAIGTHVRLACGAEAFAEVLAMATAAHNASPHSSIGTSPINFLSGMDSALPGWSEWVPLTDPEARELILGTHRTESGGPDLSGRTKLKLAQTASHPTEMRPGDVVVQLIRSSAQADSTHVTGEKSYAAKWTYPKRILKKQGSRVLVRPLWTGQDAEWVQIADVKRVFEPDDLQHLLLRTMLPANESEEEPSHKRPRA